MLGMDFPCSHVATVVGLDLISFASSACVRPFSFRQLTNLPATVFLISSSSIFFSFIGQSPFRPHHSTFLRKIRKFCRKTGINY